MVPTVSVITGFDCTTDFESFTLYSQTPLLRTPLRPEKVSVLQSVRIKDVAY